ncbi:phenylacetate--CoA ligase family protein [Nocardiopsis changdeensis]|uniref:phenylacetate--CoA ligase family protein n=1 Tax=Nocardiopsis changdeensis TaxID=2831969 RepID=UPI003F44CFD4
MRKVWEDRLPEALARASRSDFYRPRLEGRVSRTGPDDLAVLPLTTKDDLRAGYPFGMLAVPRRRVVSYHESSGTSAGRTTASFHTEADWEEMLDRFRRGRTSLGPDDTVLVRVPYAMVTIGHQVHAAARAAGAMVVPADARSTAMTYRRVLGLLRDLEVTVAAALPTEPLLWAACARETGGSPREHAPHLRTLIATGEPLSDARRNRIGELWGCDVVVSYGNSECGSSLAGECPEGTLHLWADRYLPEVLDPATGRTTREGNGRLVVTTLYREAMPLVRYDTGDAVELSYGECPCGWALPRIRVLGRWDQGVEVGGRTVFGSQVEEVVFGLPARLGALMWRARTHGGRLHVRIEVPEPDAAEAVAVLTGDLDAAFGPGCRVEAVPLGTLVPLDELTRASHVAKPRYLSAAEEDTGLAYPAPAAP